MRPIYSPTNPSIIKMTPSPNKLATIKELHPAEYGNPNNTRITINILYRIPSKDNITPTINPHSNGFVENAVNPFNHKDNKDFIEYPDLPCFLARCFVSIHAIFLVTCKSNPNKYGYGL